MRGKKQDASTIRRLLSFLFIYFSGNRCTSLKFLAVGFDFRPFRVIVTEPQR